MGRVVGGGQLRGHWGGSKSPAKVEVVIDLASVTLLEIVQTCFMIFVQFLGTEKWIWDPN